MEIINTIANLKENYIGIIDDVVDFSTRHYKKQVDEKNYKQASHYKSSGMHKLDGITTAIVYTIEHDIKLRDELVDYAFDAWKKLLDLN